MKKAISVLLCLMFLPAVSMGSDGLRARLMNRANGYKAIIGDEFYTSEGDYQWSPFVSSVPVMLLASSDLKKALSSLAESILKKDMEADGDWRVLMEFFLGTPGAVEILDRQSYNGKYKRYIALKDTMLADFSNIYMAKFAYENKESLWLSSGKVIFLFGRSPEWYLVGLWTVAIET